MDDVRLTVGLTAWLQDGEVPPPDARMSAGRVMAGVEQAGQLGRWWPPATLAGKVQPVPALGAARPLGASGAATGALGASAQSTAPSVVSRLTPLRIFAALAVLVLISGALLIVPRLIPGPGDPSAGAVVSPFASPSATSAAVPTSSPVPTPAVIRSANGQLAASTHSGTSWPFEWRSSGIVSLADSVSLRIGDLEFNAPGEVLVAGTTQADHAELEARWFEDDVEQRLDISLDLDESHWWVDSIRAGDGATDGAGSIYFDDLQALTRTPLGQSLVGDLSVRSTSATRAELAPAGSAWLQLDGLKLTAFEPGSRPAPLPDCDYFVDDRVSLEWIEAADPADSYWSTEISGRPLRGSGEPLKGIKRMSPAEVEDVLQGLGLCYRFVHSWRPMPRFEDERLNEALGVYVDRRCTAPETGQVGEIDFGPDVGSDPASGQGGSGIVVYVGVNEEKPQAWPEPPPGGTDCPVQ